MREPALDIRRHTFTRAFRGFDQAEVEAVLQAVAVDYDEAYATLRQLQQALAEATAEAEQLLQGERSVIKIMRSADEHARMCIGSAHRQAARLVEAAEEHARMLLAGAEEDRTALATEVRAIERRRADILSALGALVESMATMASPDAIRAHDLVPTPATVPDPARHPGPGEPVADRAVLHSPVPSNVEPEGRPSPVVVPAVAPAVVRFLHDATPDTRVDDAAESAGDPPFEEEVVVRTTRQRLFTMSKRRAAMAAAAIVLSAAAIAWPSVQGSRRTAASEPPPAQTPAAIAVHEAGDEGAPPTAAAPAMPEPAPVAPLVIALKSSRPCWVRVTVDGVPEEIMLAAGDEIARTATTTLRVRIGDAAALSVEVNGHALPPLGRPGQVVDKTFTAGSLPR